MNLVEGEIEERGESIICLHWRKCVNLQKYVLGLIFGLAMLKSLCECSFLVLCWLTDLGDGEREAGLLDVSGLWPAGNKNILKNF